ncbi:RNA polymerase sigma factor [Kineococcus rubinsiae]|uniref:RNA polymerase sigma factor n=1 Tax=Kineococcus rubinsiae TaxID=2609562 RepID=UPI0014317AB2|nr:SigE family RNA polymerase sigma factor [Kineococcus rubinsiae]NIZ90316.1 SigE family RNA polymerase sigma factor [Kineococcus rubinsiae]
MRQELEASFDAFAVAAMPRLRQLAFAWSRDWHRADDLVQDTFERVYAAWPRVRRDEHPFAYARTTMLRHLISEQRRPWRRRETTGLHLGLHADEDPPDPQTPTAEATSLNLDLLTAIAALPARQRAVVLLRYVEDLTVSEVADTLNISEGTVKSQAHHARTALQAHLGPGYRDDYGDHHRGGPEPRVSPARPSGECTKTGGQS